jgi:hypothetical protein
MDINAVVEKYISLRDEQAEISKRHAEELKPYSEQMDIIERWLHQKMNEIGVDNVKTPSGTAFKAVSKSVKLQEADQFKDFVFMKAARALANVRPQDPEQALNILREATLWDMIDFRAGKKGILEFIESDGTVPPGVTIDSFTKVNIRRS